MESEDFKMPATIGELMDPLIERFKAIGFKEIVEPPQDSSAEKEHKYEIRMIPRLPKNKPE